jgi:hypothetical protein
MTWLLMGDTNAKIDREKIHHPMIGKYSLHATTNENGFRLIDFAAGRQMAIRSTYFMHKRIHIYTPGTIETDALSTKLIIVWLMEGTSRTSSMWKRRVVQKLILITYSLS